MENWQQVLYSSMRAADNDMLFKAFTAIYYISWLFIGNFILLNLFLAILIDSFNVADAEIENEDAARVAEEEANKLRQMRLIEEKKRRLKKLGQNDDTIKRTLTESSIAFSKRSNTVKMKKQKASFTGTKIFKDEMIDDIEDLDNKDVRMILIEQGIIKARKGEIDEKKIGPSIEAENSLYLFNRLGCFRRNVFYI